MNKIFQTPICLMHKFKNVGGKLFTIWIHMGSSATMRKMDSKTLMNYFLTMTFWLRIVHGFSDPSYCISTTYAVCKQGSLYTQSRYKTVKYYCHRIAALFYFGANHPDKHLNASHLCNNDSCVNPCHLAFENNFINRTRMTCQHYCPIEREYKCPHNPPCFCAKNTIH